jgi:hypothetical protein
MALPVVLLAMLLAWARIDELNDPFVGPAIVHEAGPSYVIQCYLASAIAVIASLVGIFQQQRVRHRLRTVGRT